MQKYWGFAIFHTSRPPSVPIGFVPHSQAGLAAHILTSHTHGVWKIAKNQSHLVKFGCGNPGILVTFLTGQENHPTFNTFRQFWPWWGVAVVEKIVKPHFGIGQGNVWWVWWGYGHYWPRNWFFGVRLTIVRISWHLNIFKLKWCIMFRCMCIIHFGQQACL